MRKLWVIAWKETYLRFTDPAVLLLTIAVPVAIALLLGVAFGDLALGHGLLDIDIPVGIVNQDQGGSLGNMGDDLARAMLPGPTEASPGAAPFTLFSVRKIDSAAAARQMVDREDLVAMLVIPRDFSRSLAADGATLELYMNNKSDVRAIAFKNAVEALANVVSARKIVVLTSVQALLEQPRTRAQLTAGLLNRELARLQADAARPETNPIQLQRAAPIAPQISLIRYFAGALAIFFGGLTALMASASLLQEQAQWTLQRMVATPTSMQIILGGNALGAFLNGVLQMVVLLAAIAAVEWITSSGLQQDDRIDLLGLALLIAATVAAATGVGMLIGGLARTYAQAANVGRALLIIMGLIGGVFFPVDLLPAPFQFLSRCTYQYWAMDGYLRLVAGGAARSVLPNLLVMAVMGLLLFGAGTWFVRRRLSAEERC